MSERVASADRVKSGVVLIVLSGVVLGLGFNRLGLQAHQPHGLAWIAQPKAELASLETLTGTHTDPAPAVATSVPPPVQQPTAVPTSAQPAHPPATKAPPSEHRAAPPAGADPDDPMGGVGASNAAGELPDIPDLDRPLSVELATVRKFVDAKAAMILDAREPDDYAAGHIPGALNIPYDTAGSDPARLEALDSGGRPIIIYCGGGTCEVSMSLAETLIYQHAKRKVLVYTGGWPDWEAAGLPVVKGTEAGGSGR